MDAAASPEAPPAAPPRHEFTATPETPKLLPRTSYGPEHEDYRRGVRRFFETEVYPHWEAWEAQGHVARDLWNKAGEAGLLCVAIPEEFGGAGSTVVDLLAMIDEAAAGLVPGPVAGTALAAAQFAILATTP